MEAHVSLPDDLTLGPVCLVVVDADRSIAFYRDVLGLSELAHERTDAGEVVRMGTPDGSVVLELLVRADATPPGRSTGLYHVALLYPDRPELARAVERIAAAGAPVDGASDHGTHEAIYLADPDGNGLELAADRPREAWPDLGNVDSIRPRALDLRDLLATVVDDERVPPRVADGLRVGHVHLHVGDVEQARAHYVDVLGFDLVNSMDSAGFGSAGGYHHHLAWNTWHGVGAPPPPAGSTGLAWWSIELPTANDVDVVAARLERAGRDAGRDTGGTLVTRDPWGTELHVRTAR